MKRVTVVVCVIAALGLVGSAGAAEYPLYAGQDIPVGVVHVSNDGAAVTVRFDTTDSSWCITETHAHIASALAGIPQTRKGNPIPGQFEFSDNHSCVNEVEYTKNMNSESVYVAAHAVVYDLSSFTETLIVSDESTEIIEVNGVSLEGQFAQLAMEPFNYPNCGSYRQDKPGSVWDMEVNKQFNFEFYGAKWIWNTPHPEHPIEGDVVTFERTFELPKGFFVNGFLVMTADNGYEVMFNGNSLGRAQLGPGFPDTLKEQVEAYPRVGDWGVASQFWQDIEWYSISQFAVPGENSLVVRAANEYMFSDDRYLTFPTMSGAATDNVPGAMPGQDPCYNPAGLIFKLFVQYLTHGETAWGGEFGDEFSAKNWARYIVYDVVQ